LAWVGYGALPLPMQVVPRHPLMALSDSPTLRDVRRLSFLLVWLGVPVVALVGVLLYLAGGMYIGITLVSVAAMGAVEVIASHVSHTQQPQRTSGR
jgi:hypothetical protein